MIRTFVKLSNILRNFFQVVTDDGLTLNGVFARFFGRDIVSDELEIFVSDGASFNPDENIIITVNGIDYPITLVSISFSA
jgi:hypothetical protein